MREQGIDCPNCHQKAGLNQFVKEVPHFGKLLFSTLSCSNCGFKLSDVFCTDFKKPSQYSARIESEKDLSIKIVKGSTATVKIPELGVLIEPGAASDGYFSNIEGLLDRIQQVAQILVNTAEKPKQVQAARKALEKIKKARLGKIKFEVIVQDAFGNSALIGNNVERKQLSGKEAAELKKPLVVLESK
jgi:zinc finger protein